MTRFALACLFSLLLLLGRANADELHFAASSGNIEGLRQLIEIQHRGVDSPDSEGTTPLMSAAGSGQVEATRYLIARGAALNRGDKWGYTALHRAVKKNQIATVGLLIEAGANVNARSTSGTTPLLVTQGYPAFGAVIDLLLAHKADVKLADENKITILLCVMYWPDPALVRRLLEAGADVKQRGHLGHNALETLCGCASDSIQDQEARRAVAEVLLQFGADPLAPPPPGEGPAADWDLPIVVAADRGHYLVVGLLLDKGGDANGRDRKGASLLHIAASGSYTFSKETTRVLIDRGARINERNRTGATPLHIAAYVGNDAVVEALLGYPACDRQAKNASGKTALDLARQGKHQKVIDLLTRPLP